MEELLLSLLYVIAEALLEALLEIVGEAVFALISRATGNLFPALLKSNRFLTTIGFCRRWRYCRFFDPIGHLIGSYSRPDSMASAC